MTYMGVEREVKLEIPGDPGQVEELLKTNGFKYVDECLEVDIYHIHPCRDLATSDEAFRFRRHRCNVGEKYVVTYKGPRLSRDDVKSRPELEAEMDEKTWYVLRAIMERLGFKPLISITKRRKIYVTEGLKAYLDELIGVGFFLEIETIGDRGIDKLRELLVLLKPLTRIIHDTYLEICLKTNKCI
ncbi:MAG: class IV adenylate cyclase [Desulfurococcaceae archaeon]